jgi:hypothetical protein
MMPGRVTGDLETTPDGEPDMRVTSKRCVVLIFTILTSLSLALISGCQRAYPVELRGVVYSAKDGAPISGVRVMLSPDLAFGNGYAKVFPVSSGQDGTFRVSFEMFDNAFMKRERWSVSLKKDGYHDITIDLGPFDEPKSSDPMRIVVAATMRENG